MRASSARAAASAARFAPATAAVGLRVAPSLGARRPLLALLPPAYGVRVRGRVNAFLVIVVQQHRHDRDLVVGLAETTGERDEALHSLDLELVSVAQTRLQEYGGALGNDALDLLLGGRLALLEVDAETLADVEQLDALETRDERHPLAGGAGPAGATDPMDIRFGFLRRLGQRVGEMADE